MFRNIIAGLLTIILCCHCACAEVNGQMEQIDAKDVKKMIEKNQELKPSAYNISGNLELSNIIIKCPINISNSIIRGDVNFSGVTFEEEVNFKNTTFKKEAKFSQADGMPSIFERGVRFDFAKFNEEATFTKGNLKVEASFKNVTFMKGANFGSVSFSSGSDFNNVLFNGNARFAYSIFNKTADHYFTQSMFNGYANFDHVIFDGDTYFDRILFSQNVYFRGTIFNDGSNFQKTQFDGDTSFNGAQFKGNTDFSSGVQFKGICDFYGTQFEKEADFSGGAQFGRSANFANAKFNITRFNYAHFNEDAIFQGATFKNNKLNLSGITFNRLFCRWNYLKNKLEYDEGAYLPLIENYKKLGYFDDANDCYYELRTEMAIRRSSIRDMLFDRLLDLSYGYGVKPWNAVYWSFGVIIILGFYYSRLTGVRNVTKETRFKKIQEGNTYEEVRTEMEQIKTQKSLIEAFKFSATVFLSGTGKLLVDPPRDFEPKEGWHVTCFGSLFALERILGLLFITLFLYAIANTILIPAIK